MSESHAARAIDGLMRLHPKGYDLSLGRITGLLDRLGTPQANLPPVIHVAGTNGKGSTIALARAVLEAAGLSVHAHTSPHLVSWHERYRLAGELVGDDVLTETIERVAAANDGAPITVFEILTAVMFLLFSEHAADVALVEVGLGGRCDATNVLETAAVSVITPVGLDHQMHLGDTLSAIAFEKAGILRAGVPAVIGTQDPEALATIRTRALEIGAPLTTAGEDFTFEVERGRMVYRDDHGLLDLPLPALSGAHQMANAATAIATARAFDRERIDEDAAERGMAEAVWPARLQRLREGALPALLPKGAELWLDGGHNGHAGQALAAFMVARRARDPRPLTLVVGMIDTKEPAAFLAPFLPERPALACVPVGGSEAGIAPETLAATGKALGFPTTVYDDLADALASIAETNDGPAPRVLICGSLYLAGEVLAANGTPPR